MKTQQEMNNEFAERDHQLIDGIKHLIPENVYYELKWLAGMRYSLANLFDILNGGQTEYYAPNEIREHMDTYLADGWSFTGYADTFHNGEGVGEIERW